MSKGDNLKIQSINIDQGFELSQKFWYQLTISGHVHFNDFGWIIKTFTLFPRK